jgi:hypothetical protein
MLRRILYGLFNAHLDPNRNLHSHVDTDDVVTADHDCVDQSLVATLAGTDR